MLCTSPAAGGAGGRATSLATKTNDAWRNDGRPQRPRARNRNGPYPLGSRRARATTVFCCILIGAGWSCFVWGSTAHPRVALSCR
ncbi:hypothetical protein LMH87_006540 [Akanthomyces muscarius]|uniref:Uncharacterized protein n=1 Tax=Akanthomyces muscarius TaxID=2231603 RepID=A0A9W8QQG5_AKAMU|nr:hypothetical protein LMH87_006540 [Akanthomyces muscarius]KAJ4164886.1 hypothetical protein LMH87_006540 [Akanthomyces muscarius]